MIDEFLTLAEASEGYYMDRGSKFLSFAFPVKTETEAMLLLQKIKKDQPKARHYCTAMRLLHKEVLERSNDDGEPSGSAGKPILGQLIKHDLLNVMIIVVRYFGGTKLGIPGLIEAYKTSAANALSAATVMKRKIYRLVRFEFEYEQLPHLINHFKLTGSHVFKTQYNGNASLTVGYSRSNYSEELKQSLKKFSQLDYDSITEYENHLRIKIEILDDEEIL